LRLNEEPRQNTRSPRGVFLGSLFYILVSFILRLYHLDAQSLWFDEGWSWHLAKMPLEEMAAATAGDRSPVLYYALLHFWILVFGESEFAMRFLSVIADTITLSFVVTLARRIQSSNHPNSQSSIHPFIQPPYLAGLLYALCPFAIWYAQEMRMYALVAMFCTASSYFLLKGIPLDRHHSSIVLQPAPSLTKDRSWVRWLIASSVCLGLAIHSHYYAIFLLPAHFVVVITQLLEGWKFEPFKRSNRPTFKPSNVQTRFVAIWLMATAVVIASVVPWLLVARGGFVYDDGFAFPLNTIDGRIIEFVRAFVSGGIAKPLPEWWWLPPSILISSITISLITSRTQDSTIRSHSSMTLIALTVLPLLAATVAVRLFYPYRSVFHPRYLIYIVPILCVLLSGAWIKFRPTTSRRNDAPLRMKSLISHLSSLISLTLLIFWLPNLYAYFTDAQFQRDDVRAATKHVVEALQPNDVIVMTRDNYALRYYYPRDKQSQLVALPNGLHGILTNDKTVIEALAPKSPNRVRLFLWQDDVVDPQRFVETTLRANGFQIGEYNFRQIRLPLYQISSQPIQTIQLKPREVNFGDTLKLMRYWLTEKSLAGDWFYLTLEWQAQRSIERDFKVFVHVLDTNGNLAFQQDKLTLNELLPTSRWEPNKIYRDPYAMVVPSELPAGEYRVVVGVYDAISGERLPVGDATFIEISKLKVENRK
jgi:uncharacterized membrane protein